MLTTHQVQRLHFDSATVTRRRMVALYRHGLINRFQPWAQGSAPFHYVLDELGAYVVAAERGVELRDLEFRRNLILGLPFSPKLPHLAATNEFFTHLAWACRQSGTHRLVRWWSESRCQRRFGPIVVPDGLGVVESHRSRCSFLLELDLGTESPQRVASKLSGYRRIAALSDCPDALLFCFPTPEREASARRRLYVLDRLMIATASWDRVEADPLGAVWLPIGEEGRWPISDLAVSRRKAQEGPVCV